MNHYYLAKLPWISVTNDYTMKNIMNQLLKGIEIELTSEHHIKQITWTVNSPHSTMEIIVTCSLLK